jgi:uridine kinase
MKRFCLLKKILFFVLLMQPAFHNQAASAVKARTRIRNTVLVAAGVVSVGVIVYQLCKWRANKAKLTMHTDNFARTFDQLLRQAQQLAREHARNKDSLKPVIAVAGCSAVGKTYFARELQSALLKRGVKVAIIRLDDFMNPEPVAGALPFHPNFDHKKAHEIITIVRGECGTITKPTWNLSGAEPVKTVETVSFEDVDLLILEGEYALSDKTGYDLLKYSALRIFMHAQAADMAEWNWKRGHGINKTTTSREKFTQDARVGIQKYYDEMGWTQKHANFIIEQDYRHTYRVVDCDKARRNLEHRGV